MVTYSISFAHESVVVIPLNKITTTVDWNQSVKILDSNDNLIGYEIAGDLVPHWISNTWISSTNDIINSKGYVSKLNEYSDGK